MVFAQDEEDDVQARHPAREEFQRPGTRRLRGLWTVVDFQRTPRVRRQRNLVGRHLWGVPQMLAYPEGALRTRRSRGFMGPGRKHSRTPKLRGARMWTPKVLHAFLDAEAS